MKALIHYFFKEDPDKMGLSELAKKWRRLEFALEFDGKLVKK